MKETVFKNPHKRRFLMEIKRNELFARLYFYACADYGHMAGDRQNCGSIYSRQKKATCKQTTKKQKSTYKTSEWGKRNIPGGLKARTVLRSTEV